MGNIGKSGRGQMKKKREMAEEKEKEDGLFDKADNNNGFFGLTLIKTLFGVSISCDLLH